VTFSGGSEWTWAGDLNETRVLQRPTGTGRTASTWYSATSFSTTIAIPAGSAYRIAVYGLDLDALGRAQTIEVLDAATGALLDRRSVSGFSGGQYWVWRVTRPVVLRVTRDAGANAVISGVFLDPA
jgi:hypothetical protein